MVSIDTVLDLAILAVRARIEAGEECNCVDLVFRRSVLVLEAAGVTFGTWASQIMIVAELAAVFSFFDTVQCCLRNLNRRVYAAQSRIPRRLLAGLGLGANGGIDGLGL